MLTWWGHPLTTPASLRSAGLNWEGSFTLSGPPAGLRLPCLGLALLVHSVTLYHLPSLLSIWPSFLAPGPASQ